VTGGSAEVGARRRLDVLVVGGGVAGLAAAERLAADGADVCCLEGRSDAGGVTSTIERDGFLFEQGPFNVLCRAPEFSELLERLGPELSLVPIGRRAGAQRGVVWNGALHRVPSGPWTALTSPLLGPVGALRAARGMLWSSSPPAAEASRATVDEVVRRRFGERVATRLVSALTVGVFGAESDQLEAASALPFLAELDAGGRAPLAAMRRLRSTRRGTSRATTPRGMISFEGGLGALPRALATRLGARLRTGAVVESLTALAGGGWRVQLVGTESFDAHHVVLAVGARETARLLRTAADPSFAPAVAELEELRHVSLAVLNLGLRASAFRAPLAGYGFLVARDEPSESALGVLYASSVFPQHAPDGAVALRVFFGGTRHPGFVAAPEVELVRAATETLRRHAGLLDGDVATPLVSQVVRWPDSIPLYEPGHSARIARVRAALRTAPSLHLAGAYLDGVSVNDCVARGIRVARSVRAAPALGAAFPRALPRAR